MGVSIWEIIITILVLVFMLGPLVHVLVSNRSHGGAKLGWFMAVFFFSWFAYIAFLILTQDTADQIKIEQESN